MLYAVKFFLILSVIVTSIDYLSRPAAPLIRGEVKPFSRSTPSTSRNKHYLRDSKSETSVVSHRSPPSLTSQGIQRKENYRVSLAFPSGTQHTVSEVKETTWSNSHFQWRTLYEQIHDNTVSRSSHEVSDNADKSNGQDLKSLHATTNSENKGSNGVRKNAEWRKSVKSVFLHSNRQFEKQGKQHRLIKRSQVSPSNRRYIYRPEQFGDNTGISGNVWGLASHFSAYDANRSRTPAYNMLNVQKPCNVYVFFRVVVIIDCSHRSLTNVPTYLFPITARWYKLCYNKITSIKDHAFNRYSVLAFLDLQGNNLSYLSNHSFAGLRNLRTLVLSYNNLQMTASVFPANVFAPLKLLRTLWLHGNNEYKLLNSTNMSYPDLALSKLSNLRMLRIDGLQSQDFGPGFGNLKNLRLLSLSGRDGKCKLRSLKNTTFVNVAHVRNLTLHQCEIHGHLIEADAFSPLTKLAILNLNDNWAIGFKHLNHIFYGLRNTTTLKYLSIRNIEYKYTIGICLDSSYIFDFPQYLEALDVGQNELEGVDRNVIGKLSPSLKTLDVCANAFAFGTYWKDLPNMKNLTRLLYNGQCNETLVPGLPETFPSHKTLMNMTVSNCSLYQAHLSDTSENGQLILKLPPKLKYVEMNDVGLMFRLTEFNIDPDNELESLSMSGNDFPKLIGPINGLVKLKTLILRSNNVKHISANFSRTLTSLEYLDLSLNPLKTLYDREQGLPVFSNLLNLKFLNLSGNEITSLDENAFQNLTSLVELYLRGNRLVRFEVDMSQILNLEMLDLSDNHITRLPPQITKYINSLLSSHGNITLNLADCLIQCNCDNFEFLKWFSQSKFKIDQRYVGSYRCTYPDNSFMYITDRYQSTFADLGKECVTKYIVFLVTGVCTVFLFCIIFGAIIYRFRWNLRYFYYAAYLRYKKSRTSNNSEYEFDVFISYAQEDSHFVIYTMSAELENRGLKVLIHGRDFKAGEYIASNIVSAVCSCKKTLVVLTRNMMNSYWCGYELQMANMESVQRGGKVLIFLLMEKIPESELGVELLYNIRNNTYIPYPDTLTDDTSMGRLWDKLVADIKT